MTEHKITDDERQQQTVGDPEAITANDAQKPESKHPFAPELVKKITVVFNKQELDQQVDQRLKHQQKQLSLPGFRTGKVPFSVVRQRYFEVVYDEVTQEIAQQKFSTELEASQDMPLGAPFVVDNNAEGGTEKTQKQLDIYYEVYPKIAEFDVKELDLEGKVVEIGDGDIDEVLERLRYAEAEFPEAEGAMGATSSAQLKIEYKTVGEESDEADESYIVLTENYRLDERSAQFVDPRIPEDLLAQVVGRERGAQWSFEHEFAPDPTNKNPFAGQVVTFRICVLSVHDMVLADLTDQALLERIGIIDGGYDKLLETARKEMTVRAEGFKFEDLKAQVYQQLLAKYDVIVPYTLISNSLKQMFNFEGPFFNLDHVKKQMPDVYRQVREENARTTLEYLIINHLAVSVSSEETLNELRADAKNYVDERGYINACLNDKNKMVELERKALLRKAMHEIIAQAKINETTISYSDMSRQNQA